MVPQLQAFKSARFRVLLKKTHAFGINNKKKFTACTLEGQKHGKSRDQSYGLQKSKTNIGTVNYVDITVK
jgi:hypothetical protein